MGFPEWQCNLDLIPRENLNVLRLDLQHFIKAEQAQERECVSSSKQAACSTTTPCMDIVFLVLAVVPHILDIVMLWLVVEVIHL